MSAVAAHQDVHAQSIVIDAVCPLLRRPEFLGWYKEGGVTVAAPTAAGTVDARTAMSRIAVWHRLLRERDDLMWIRQASDVELAKRSGRLGIYLHFQGTDSIEQDLDLIDLYKFLGVGMVQLTYNVRNLVGDGCEERTDAGLSRFGIKLVQRLNAARIIVDCSHTGVRTSLEAVEHSTAPVVLSHSNVSHVHSCPRNVPDELIDAIARSGGVVGVAGFPGMLGGDTRPSLQQFIAHIDAIVQRVGIDHVGLGIDYYSGQAGVASDEQARVTYDEAVRSGMWSASYPPPPHHYPTGIETPRTLPALTRALIELGYQVADVRKILGGNWLRIMRAVWG
ncbi:MAG TPA: membrane dipeptidase [Steroidobacter sp.]|uniref:membrane dipeptidase n=1 Tax=Steroidobacter sp. TaxID=1978227 RepID=UPI002ED93B4B